MTNTSYLKLLALRFGDNITFSKITFSVQKCIIKSYNQQNKRKSKYSFAEIVVEFKCTAPQHSMAIVRTEKRYKRCNAFQFVL